MWKEYFEALHQYFYKAKVIIYASLLAIVAASSLIRSQFPELHPPWQLLRWMTTSVLFGILLVPPLMTVIRRRRKEKFEKK
jgi:hypothetical protein